MILLGPPRFRTAKNSSRYARPRRPNIVRHGVAEISQIGGKEPGQPAGLRVVGLWV